MINICYELQISIHISYFIRIMKYISIIENTLFFCFFSECYQNEYYQFIWPNHEYHIPRFLWNNGMSIPQLRDPCEVAIIWPEFK